MSHTLYWKVEASAAGTIYDLSRDLASFTIEEEDRSPTMLTILVNDPFAVFSHAFREGVGITVELGTDDDHSKVFDGRIYHVDGSMPQDGTATLTIKAYDATMAMGLRQRNRRFRDVPLSDVVRTVTAPYLNGMPLQLELLGDPVYSGEGLRQREVTDLRFLRCLADEAQCVMGITLSAEGTTFVFRTQAAVLRDEPTLFLHYGRCDVLNRLLTFNGQTDVSAIAIPRTLCAMDPETGEIVDPRDTQLEEVGEIEDRLRDDNLSAFESKHEDRGPVLREFIDAAVSVEPALRQELGTSRRDAVPTFANADRLIQEAEQQPSATLHGMSGTGTSVGNKDLHVRKAVGIEGAGRFSGAWYVSKATHTLDAQGYRTEFTVQR